MEETPLDNKNMTQELKEQLIKRLKSFAWRMGSYVVVSGIALIVDNLGMFNVPPEIVVIIAYAAGEFTKFINTYSANK